MKHAYGCLLIQWIVAVWSHSDRPPRQLPCRGSSGVYPPPPTHILTGPVSCRPGSTRAPDLQRLPPGDWSSCDTLLLFLRSGREVSYYTLDAHLMYNRCFIFSQYSFTPNAQRRNSAGSRSVCGMPRRLPIKVDLMAVPMCWNCWDPRRRVIRLPEPIGPLLLTLVLHITWHQSHTGRRTVTSSCPERWRVVRRPRLQRTFPGVLETWDYQIHTYITVMTETWEGRGFT